LGFVRSECSHDAGPDRAGPGIVTRANDLRRVGGDASDQATLRMMKLTKGRTGAWFISASGNAGSHTTGLFAGRMPSSENCPNRSRKISGYLNLFRLRCGDSNQPNGVQRAASLAVGVPDIEGQTQHAAAASSPRGRGIPRREDFDIASEREDARSPQHSMAGHVRGDALTPHAVPGERHRLRFLRARELAGNLRGMIPSHLDRPSWAARMMPGWTEIHRCRRRLGLVNGLRLPYDSWRRPTLEVRG